MMTLDNLSLVMIHVRDKSTPDNKSPLNKLYTILLTVHLVIISLSIFIDM